MLCNAAATRQNTVVVTENEAFFPVNSMALRLFNLSFLEKLVTQYEGEEQQIPKEILRKWKKLVNREYRIMQSIQMVSRYPFRVTKVIFLEDGVKEHRYYNDFNTYVIPENMPLWTQLVRDACFMDRGSQVNFGTGERDNVGISTCNNNDPPDNSDRLYDMKYELSAYSHTCSFLNCANLLSILGFHAEAQYFSTLTVDNKRQALLYCKKIISQLNSSFHTPMFKLNQTRNHDCQTILEWDKTTKAPMVIEMKGYHSNHINHCIGIFNGQIIDGSFKKSFKLTQHNLDFAIGNDNKVEAVVEGFIIVPTYQMKLSICKKLNAAEDRIIIKDSVTELKKNYEMFFVTQQRYRCKKRKKKSAKQNMIAKHLKCSSSDRE